MKRELLTFPAIRTINLILLACVLQASFACGPRSPADHPQVNSESPGAIDINSASAEELEHLPGIGEATARKIVAHRDRFGSFRRKEHLLLVEGISEKKYLSLKDLLTAHPFKGKGHLRPEGHSSRGSNGRQDKTP